MKNAITELQAEIKSFIELAVQKIKHSLKTTDENHINSGFARNEINTYLEIAAISYGTDFLDDLIQKLNLTQNWIYKYKGD